MLRECLAIIVVALAAIGGLTWTILALSMRTAEHIIEEQKKGNL